MTGIYKITNKINQHCYIGLSTTIEQRKRNHKSIAFNSNSPKYNYPLYAAIRKYGIENFDFTVIETCPISLLKERESYWIKYYQPEYNQTTGGEYNIVAQRLTFEQVQQIQKILIDDTEGKVSHKALAEQFNVSKDTIRDINVGRTWVNDALVYPLHYSQFDANKPDNLKKMHDFKTSNCIDCGVAISRGAQRCKKCQAKQQITIVPVTRENLKTLIRTLPFTQIAEQFHVSDRTIAKWCIKYDLPSRKKDINTYSDENWSKV